MMLERASVDPGRLWALALPVEDLPAWLWMWLLAFGIFIAGKCLAWRSRSAAGAAIRPGRSLAYFVAWPGMDANAFCQEPTTARPAFGDWKGPIARCLLGLAFIWLVPRFVVLEVGPYLTHWLHRLSYWATNAVFVYLTLVYAWTACRGGGVP